MTSRTIAIGGVTTRPPFATLFDIDETTRDAIADDMRANGFDASTPIQVWPENGRLTVIDGHTRLSAAFAVGLDEVVVYDHHFDSELSALEFAIHQQRDRRNMTPLEMVNAVKVVDETRRKEQGGTGANQYTKVAEFSSENSAKSHPETAKIVGTSPMMVTRVRAILDDPTGQAMQEIREGATISGAATRRWERKRGPSPDTNGHAAPDQPFDEPWYRTKSAGLAVKTALIVSARDIRKELDRLAADGIEPVAYMGDRRVTPDWNKALKEANAIAALLRSVIRSAE